MVIVFHKKKLYENFKTEKKTYLRERKRISNDEKYSRKMRKMKGFMF